MAEEELLDVTEVVRSAATDLKVGEIIHDDEFTLQDAMSAIGLMNPRMDVGFGERIWAKDIELRWDLSLEEMVSLCDELLAREASWLEAHTLPQTMYACVYLLRLDECRPKLLFLLLRMAAARVSIQKDIIVRVKGDDEEDFVSCSFGLNLLPVLTVHEHHVIVEQAMMALDGVEGKFADALRSRIMFRDFYYACLHALCEGEHLERPAEVENQLQRALQALQQCESTTAPVPAPGFDERVNHHLLLTSPPRNSAIATVSQGFEYFRKLIDQMIQLCRLTPEFSATEGALTGGLLVHLLNVIAAFNACLRPAILLRCILRRQLVELTDLNAIVSERMEVELMSSPSLQHSLVYLLKVMCRNRGQQRRKILPILTWLSRESSAAMFRQGGSVGALSPAHLEGMRQRLSQVALASTAAVGPGAASEERARTPLEDGGLMVAELSVFVVLHHLLLGFECELYSRFELHAVYVNVGSLLRSSVELHTGAQPPSATRLFLRLFDEGRMHLCRAVEVVLRCAGVGWRQMPFGSERKWYTDRFQLADNRGRWSALLSFDEFVERRDAEFCSLLDVPTSLATARRCFEAASRVCTETPAISRWLYDEVRGLAKTTVANSVELARAGDQLQVRPP